MVKRNARYPQKEKRRQETNCNGNATKKYYSDTYLELKDLKAPELLSFKNKMIHDLNKKKTNSSRANLIESLKEKLEKNNTAQIKELNTYVYQTKSKEEDFMNEMENMEFNEDKIYNNEKKDTSRKLYKGELMQVIENSDVILEVLDSRDPQSCRSKDLEEQIVSHKDPKKLILILNKIDLIPIENAIKWRNYLKEDFPTILFKANTQNQSSHLGSSNLYNSNIDETNENIEQILNSNKSVGGENLLNLLKNYARIDSDTKKTITVGIVGYPNVGKSSIINSMKRGKVVGVSNVPGYTKSMQEIILDKNIKLLDCPGVVLNRSNDTENLVMHHVIKLEDIKDPIQAVLYVLKKVRQEELINLYKITDYYETIEQFLYLLGSKMGKFKKGGLVDLEATARIILNDWNKGKIKYYTEPPTNEMETE